MREGTYVTILSWMVDRLDLKNTELLIYAIIYGFSQEENSEYTGSLNYLSKWTKSSKKTVIESLKKLVNKNLILKTDMVRNGVKFCSYKCNLNGGEKITPGVVKNLHQGGEKITPNNIEYINTTISNTTIGENSKNKTFIIPTVEEISAYCKERKNNVDAETFFNFYESKGWMVGKNKMKDWKAAVRTWERNRKGNTSSKPQNENKPYYECVNPNVDYSQDNSKDLFGDWA